MPGTMSKIIIFTDLHMLPEGGRIIGLDPFQRLKAGIDHVNAYHADADRVVITGDLAHHGDAESYRRLKSLIDTFIPPVAITIGNHDRREAFLETFRDVPTDPNGFVQQVVDLPDCRLVLLDTLFAPPYDYPESHKGLLCEKRLDWLDSVLSDTGGRPALLFMHHPPHATGFSGMDAIRLINEDDFYARIRRHGATVRHIFAGHVHRTISGSCRGVPFSVFKSPMHQQPMPFNTDDTSLSVDEPAAYGIALVTADGVLVHTEDYEIASRNAVVA